MNELYIFPHSFFPSSSSSSRRIEIECESEKLVRKIPFNLYEAGEIFLIKVDE